MRPILVNVPSKLLFALLIAAAVITGAIDLWRNRNSPTFKIGSTPVYLGAGAGVLHVLKSSAWGPVPIYAYGVMLGTSLIAGWFLAMRLAQQDGIPEQEAGTIYMWSAVY